MTARHDERPNSGVLLQEAAKLRACVARAHSPEAAALLLRRAAELERAAAVLELTES
jgi:hypothetical protein